MEREFWISRWEAGQIGFHQPEVNPWLTRHPFTRAGATLVPLCGKTVDLHWLAQDGPVVGVELSDLACAQFFSEAALTPERASVGGFERWRHGAIEIWCGDFFAFEGCFERVWDRAALIALPPSLRARYAAAFARLVAPGGEIRLVTLSYDQALRSGPPFAVPDDEVRALYGDAFFIERLGSEDALTPGSRYASWGLPVLEETAWRLVRRGI